MRAASSSSPLLGRRVTLCVTGSIAAYKAVILARRLLELGAELEVVLTRSAEHFVGRATFSGITGKAVHLDAHAADVAGELHVRLAAQTELLLVAPATADALARMSQGRADDLLGALALCVRCPILLAPAMHPTMWTHPATLRNRAWLSEHAAVHWVGPVDGPVASGDSGVGRMAEPEEISQALQALFEAPAPARDLTGKRVLVSAGPTVEPLDPVRLISNRSSGKLGFAVARAAQARGAAVTLVTGPVALETPNAVTRWDVQTASEMRERLWLELGADLQGVDALIMAAAVGDYRLAASVGEKRPRAAGLDLQLIPNPDLIAEIGAKRTGASPLLVAFALESASGAELVAKARQKLDTKRVDAVIANHTDALAVESSSAMLVTRDGVQAIEHQEKAGVAAAIVDWVATRLRGNAE